MEPEPKLLGQMYDGQRRADVKRAMQGLGPAGSDLERVDRSPTFDERGPVAADARRPVRTATSGCADLDCGGDLPDELVFPTLFLHERLQRPTPLDPIKDGGGVPSTFVDTVVRRRSESTGSGRPRLNSTLITDRDETILREMVELRLATVPLLHGWFFPKSQRPETVYNWIGRMTRAGLLTKQSARTTNGYQPYRPTRTAYRFLGVAGRPRDVKLVEHTLCVAEAYLSMKRDGWRVLSERAIEVDVAHGARDSTGRILRGKYWTQVGDTVHRPDLVAEQHGLRVHVEVETTLKDDRRYTDLLSGVAQAVAAGRISGVQYVVPRPGQVQPERLEAKLTKAAHTAAKRFSNNWRKVGDFGWEPPLSLPNRAWWSVSTLDTTWDTTTDPDRKL